MHENGKFFKPIGRDEMANFLGTPQDYGCICTSDAVNKFSKMKPMEHENQKPKSLDWYAARSYGLYIPYFTNFKDMVEAVRTGDYSKAANYIAGREPWSYEKPSYFYRLDDFHGYYHDAEQFIYQIEMPTPVVPLEGYTLVRTRLGEPDNDTVRAKDVNAAGVTTPYMGLAFSWGTYNIFDYSAMAMATVSTLETMSGTFDLTQKLPITRGDTSESREVTMFAYLSHDAVTEKPNTGYFIPLPMSTGSVRATIEGIEPHLVFDEVMPHSVDSAEGYALFLMEAKPNGILSTQAQLVTYLRNGEEWGLIPFNVSLPYVFEGTEQCRVNVEARVYFSGAWTIDVYAKNAQGQVVAENHYSGNIGSQVPIEDNEINTVEVWGTVGSDSYGWVGLSVMTN